jgi:dihydrofolate reductase
LTLSREQRQANTPMKPKISIIAAIGKNRELGKNNQLLWKIPEDLRRFKSITNNHPIIMGLNTFNSIGHALPNRTNIVLSHPPLPSIEGVAVVGTIDEAISLGAMSAGGEEVFFIGGGQIYKQIIPSADKLYITLIESTADADTFFPDYSMFTKKVFEEKGNFGGLNYTFIELEK